jgi:hypothetical protein
MHVVATAFVLETDAGGLWVQSYTKVAKKLFLEI